MERVCRLAIWAFLAVGMVGCSDPGAASRPSDATADSSAIQATNPAEAVYHFLEAVRQGNDAAAGSLLTDAARKKTAEMDMVVAPPGSDTASFEVGEVQMDGQNGARVASAWSDVDHEGSRRTDQITWILRRESQGWRIAGMAAQVFPDQDPIVLNFEDPQEMLRKQRMAEEDSARRSQPDQIEARKPEDPFQSGRN